LGALYFETSVGPEQPTGAQQAVETSKAAHKMRRVRTSFWSFRIGRILSAESVKN
jgi:hypothetical protein